MKYWVQPLLALLTCMTLAGCPSVTPAPSNQNNSADGNGSNGNTTSGIIGNGGSVTESALSFQGTFGGAVSTESSTTAGSQSARTKPRATELPSGAVGWFEDLEGNRLLDAGGEEYPQFFLHSNGGFDVSNLPVGVDIMVKIDLDGDGKADLCNIINIPRNAGNQAGALDDIVVDPLSTLIIAKLKAILAAGNANPEELPISPSGLIERIRNAFEHLFEDASIDQEITLADLQNLTDAQLAELFDKLVPDAAQIGMRMCAGNLLLAAADDVTEVVQAVAQILLQGGFAIADDPDGIDLSFLADLPDVEALTFAEFRQSQQPDGSAGDQAAQNFPQPTIYVSKLGETDRNHPNDGAAEGPGRRGPLFSEHMLKRLADLHLSNKTISMKELHQIVVNAEFGMGARLLYRKPNGAGLRPAEVFETKDGGGVERDVARYAQGLRDLGLTTPNPNLFREKLARLRAELLAFLLGTAEPAFERLFDGILLERVPGADEFARLIRDARAHLPLSRSGPASFFVVATSDVFKNPDAAAPVRVNVELDADGMVTSAVFNADGAFYLGFGSKLENGGMAVHFIHRETGRFLRDYHGRPQEVDLSDDSIFGAVNDESFFNAVSETSSRYLGAPALEIPNPDFMPEATVDIKTNPPVIQAFVLMTQPGPGGLPVRVNYAWGADGPAATFDEEGAYYLLFTERTPTEGLFALINGMTGEVLFETPGDEGTRVLIAAADVQGADLSPEIATHVYGIEAPNAGYDFDGDPYYDDINDNGMQDVNEPSFSFRPFLGNLRDWHSTRVEYYYRRADNNGFVDKQDIDFHSETPATRDGVALVARNFRPRLNAFRFGRPNLTLNLLTAFSPPEFFDGTHALDAETRLNPFTAIAVLNLAFNGIQNLEIVFDPDGPQGPLPSHEELINAEIWTPPLGDPLLLLLDGFDKFAQ